ncbi:MAG: phosphate ABC transporter permease PstA [Oscillospiraceae bacterium]|nr:phosphate ABC transporter permease PstA [Oscillospiraceae bacterium]
MLRFFVILAAVLTAAVVVSIVGYIAIKGIPYIKPSLFAWKYTSQNVSLMPSLVNTVLTLILALVIATPLGIFAAVYLAEYAKRGNTFVKIIRMAAETLSGIPSIIYGLFGYLTFVLFWRGYSILAGGLTLAIMVLPVIMRTTEEALLAVPDMYREGSFGLGAGRLRTVLRVVLPPAIPGILAGVILATGRIVGETAALVFTAGSTEKIPSSLFDSAATLAVHMYNISREGLHIGQAYATALVLIALVVLINMLSAWVAKKMTGEHNG